VRRACPVPFGFGGLTLPDRGAPVPCRLLIAEMARISARFSFLRRSFLRDITGRSLQVEVPRLLEAISTAADRTHEEIRRDRDELLSAVSSWLPPATAATPAVHDDRGAA
jgi:hypothetical protein